MKKRLLTALLLLSSAVGYAQFVSRPITLVTAAEVLKGKKILFIERQQYTSDHHNTATLFQFGEINQDSYTPGGALRVFDVDSREVSTLLETVDGVVRDPELSFDGERIIFSMRKNKEDGYHIYEIDIDGSNLKQLTFAKGVSDIDPLYLPNGKIVFSSTREPKYCMCNRHIMANLYTMDSDGANLEQVGVSTLFEGHAGLLNDGRIIYDRWEYVDRNFGDAQGLWTVNPDGTKHAIYYGNNTASPGGVIDARAIPGSDEIVCIFGSCHDRPWGAMAVLDRKKGVDGREPVMHIWPKETIDWIGNDGPGLDKFKSVSNFYEDPYPLGGGYFLVSRSIWYKKRGWQVADQKMGIYLVGTDGTEELVFEGVLSLFDPMPLEPRFKPNDIPSIRTDSENGVFYLQNVYEGTHMQGVEKGSVKYLRIVESPAKTTWSKRGWFGEGEQAPGVNWHSFEVKRVLGIVPVDEDGSANFEAPAGKHLYFQALDKDMKMIQSMRSGVSLMPGEVNGCVGCHEDRLTIPVVKGHPTAIRRAAVKMDDWMVSEPKNFSYMDKVQPILDKHCVSCHDFDNNNRAKLVLAKDKNPYFNAAYVNMYVGKVVSLVGGGPASVQDAYSWGSHASKLSKIVENNHRGVKLSDEEIKTLYEWMDLNGVYYAGYETSFEENLAGRSPLNDEEMTELSELTGLNFLGTLNRWNRTMGAQISFDRPKESPCLDSLKGNKAGYKRAVELITIGGKRLKATPRGDIFGEVATQSRMQQQLEKYIYRLGDKERFESVESGCKIYDEQK